MCENPIFLSSSIPPFLFPSNSALPGTNFFSTSEGFLFFSLCSWVSCDCISQHLEIICKSNDLWPKITRAHLFSMDSQQLPCSEIGCEVPFCDRSMVYINLNSDPDLPAKCFLAFLCPGACAATWTVHMAFFKPLKVVWYSSLVEGWLWFLYRMLGPVLWCQLRPCKCGHSMGPSPPQRCPCTQPEPRPLCLSPGNITCCKTSQPVRGLLGRKLHISGLGLFLRTAQQFILSMKGIMNLAEVWILGTCFETSKRQQQQGRRSKPMSQSQFCTKKVSCRYLSQAGLV